MTPTPYITRLAHNDGNSCLKAFALGFADLVLAEKTYRVSKWAKSTPMYDVLQRHSGQSSWESFVDHLKTLKRDPARLQTDLANLFTTCIERLPKPEMTYVLIEELFVHHMLGRFGRKLCDGGYYDYFFENFRYLKECFEIIGKPVFRWYSGCQVDMANLENTIKGLCFSHLKVWWLAKGFQEFEKEVQALSESRNIMQLALLSAAFKIKTYAVARTPMYYHDEFPIPQIILGQASETQWEYLQHPRFGILKSVDAHKTKRCQKKSRAEGSSEETEKSQMGINKG